MAVSSKEPTGFSSHFSKNRRGGSSQIEKLLEFFLKAALNSELKFRAKIQASFSELSERKSPLHQHN